MNLEQVSELDRLITASQVWPVTDVPFELCMDPSSNETTTVNLAHHIGPDTTDEEAINNHSSSFMAHIRTEAPLRCHANFSKNHPKNSTFKKYSLAYSKNFRVSVLFHGRETDHGSPNKNGCTSDPRHGAV
jgi:hypothetical protein